MSPDLLNCGLNAVLFPHLSTANVPRDENSFRRDNNRMSDQSVIFFQRLDERMRAVGGLSDRALSLKAEGSADLIRSARRNGHIPNARNLSAIARTLGVTTDWLLGRDSASESLPSDAGFSDTRLDFIPQRPQRDLPVLGTGHCGIIEFGSNGDAVRIEQTQFEPTTVIRYVTRPLALMGVPSAYAIYFVGESMYPRFQPGEMGIVDPRRPPARGDDVLVQLRSEDSDEITSILVKRLVRQSPDFVELEQYNPAIVFKVPVNRVARIHRIVPPAELLGG